MPYSSKRAIQPAAKRIFPDVGDPAPDAALTDTNGDRVTLSSFWTRSRVVLVFLRHFGCPFCRQQVAWLRGDYARFTELNTEVVCIGMGPYKAGKAFSVYFDLPFPVLVSEEDASVYGRYGLTRGTFAQMMGFGVVLRGLAALKFGVGAVHGDPNQMPGTFIVDTSGAILYARRAQDQADNFEPDELLAIIGSK